MTVEAKPPIRRNQGAGGFLIVLAVLAVSIPLVVGAGVTLVWLFGRSRVEVSRPPEPVVVYQTDVAYEPAISSEFGARIRAAQQIQNISERDEAFAVLAPNHANNSDEAKQALDQISDLARRDLAAWETAQRFSKQNRSQEALSMVDRMTDQRFRDAALRAIATGQWPDQPPGRGGMETVVEEAAVVQ